jgi:hypothetical protein
MAIETKADLIDIIEKLEVAGFRVYSVGYAENPVIAKLSDNNPKMNVTIARIANDDKLTEMGE